jgi:hypothetical protein
MKGLFSEQENTKYEAAALLFFGGIAIFLRMLGLVTAGAIEMDGVEYAGAAEHFARGEFGQALKGVRVPFYPLLTGLFNLIIPDVELAGRLVSLVAALLLIVFCFFMIRRLFGERTAIYATFFVTVHPYMIRFSSPVLSEALATFLFTVAVFLFYSGWVNNRSREIGLSGLFLTLAYLTRPEYIIYFAPLTILLLIRERRFLNTAAFLSCFILIAFAFLIYIRMETGFWVIDKKMLAWKEKAAAGSSLAFFFGSLSATGIVKNIPVVLLRFGEAIFPPLLFLAILGFKRVEPRYRLLVIVLVATHVLGRSFVPHATKRYSVEFAPVIMVFSAQGIAALFDFFRRYRYRLPLFYVALCIIAGLSLFQGIAVGSHGRELHKQAGLYLRGEQAGGNVASRLPILTFYARTGWVDLPKTWAENQSCEKLRGVLDAGNVRYLAIDDRMKEEAASIVSCLTEFRFSGEFRSGGDYVRLYQRQSR